MNKERIRHLADVIERQPDAQAKLGAGFCMRKFFHECGTPACIAGWAHALFSDPVDDALHFRASYSDEILGLSRRQGDLLFEPDNEHAYFGAVYGETGYVSAKRAAAVLRHLADTGEVDWSVRPETPQDQGEAEKP